MTLNLETIHERDQQQRDQPTRPPSRFIFPYWLANPSKRLANRS